MKLNFIFFLFILFVLRKCDLKSQNIITNGGFENGSTDQDGCYCRPGSSFEFLSSWESNTVKIGNSICYSSTYYHSPDWFTNGYGPCTNNAFSGLHCVGASEYELFCQKIPQSTIQANSRYLLQFYAQLPSTFLCGGTNSLTQGSVYIYLSKSKIKYKNNKDLCESKYKEYTNGAKVLVGVLDFSEIPFNDNFFKVMLSIDFPSSNYNWLTIDIHPLNESLTYNCDKTYYLFDEISLRPGCVNGCSGVDGYFSILVNQMHRPDDPFKIYGLQNVHHVDLIIKQINNEVFSLHLDNPPSKIAWDGKCGGVETSAGTYEYYLTCVNDCGTYEKSGYLTKTNDSQDPTLPDPYFQYYEVTKPLKPCCPNNPDIVLENIVLVQDRTIYSAPTVIAPLLYKAIRSIKAGPAVVVSNQPLNNTVVFEAGEFIELLPGFETQLGSDFTAQIVPCDPEEEVVILESKNVIENDGKDDFFGNDTDLELSEDPVLLVSPNPFESEFSLSIKSSDDIIIENIDVFNSTGQYFFSVSDINRSSTLVNTVEWPDGIYFVRVLLSNGEFSKAKLIKSNL